MTAGLSGPHRHREEAIEKLPTKRSPSLARLLQSIPELRLIRNDDGVSPRRHGARSLALGQREACPRGTSSVTTSQ